MDGVAVVAAPPVVAIVGPTASGKSALALAVARERGGEIVSCDSLQVYRGLDVGSAKATADERAMVPHHLLDVVEPDQDFSAADYARRARLAIDDITARGCLPVVAGGTGLYLRALRRGLFVGPSRDPDLRHRLEAMARRHGDARLHRLLARVDPDAAARIEVNDRLRVIRALEVYRASGRTLSAHHRADAPVADRRRWLVVGLDPPRDALRAAVEARTRAMFEGGLIAEARELLGRFDSELRPLRANDALREAPDDVVPSSGRRALVPGSGGRARGDPGVARLMRRFGRAIVVVCDGLGVGEAPDAAAFGDQGSDTLGHVLASREVRIPHLKELGLGNLTPTYDGARHPRPEGAWGKMAEKSAGKDTATGHWEMAGLVTRTAFKVYSGGFPLDAVRMFEERIGRKVLGNKSASGTEILKELGEEHLRTSSPILYTSGDSVFQVAAHEEVIPPDELYRICRIGYEIACLQYGVCRVIARPFVGTTRENFKRTPNRRDFPVPPAGETLLDRLAGAGWPVFGVGKIEDIFTGRGISGAVHTTSDSDGIDQTVKAMEETERGLIFTNLVDFDTLYGHRNDVPGYAANLELLDARIPDVLERMREDDVFILTADHGCDPADVSTDHTRENVPLLVHGARVRPGRELGVRATFADLGATLAQNFELPPLAAGTSFLEEL
ncbi:MAG: hypothetical protein DMF77_21325 [Acidobacteria bacterium]|nr:MAG: hypothetical protein DMF77_21325 [Acidobacteriota bacterium]